MNHPGEAQPNVRCYTAVESVVGGRHGLKQRFTPHPSSQSTASVYSSPESNHKSSFAFQCAVLMNVKAGSQLLVDYRSDLPDSSGGPTKTTSVSNSELWQTYGFVRRTNQTIRRRKGSTNDPSTEMTKVQTCQEQFLSMLPTHVANAVARLLESKCIHCDDLLGLYSEYEELRHGERRTDKGRTQLRRWTAEHAMSNTRRSWNAGSIMRSSSLFPHLA
jgi:hypothetical protein